MIVPDASAIVEVLLRSPAAAAVEAHLFRAGEALHAPHLIDVEVMHALRRYEGSGVISEARGREALRDLSDLPLARYPHTLLMSRVWDLRRNLTAYDATYVALAEALGATLVTRDSGLASAPGHRVRIILV